MGDRRKGKTHQPWEGRDPDGRFMKITYDMLKSAAWQDLTLRQQGLYVAFKSKYYQKKERGILLESNFENIKMPYSEYRRYYGSTHTFLIDRQALIDHGFISIKEPGRNTRTENVYAFSDEWTQYVRGKEHK